MTPKQSPGKQAMDAGTVRSEMRLIILNSLNYKKGNRKMSKQVEVSEMHQLCLVPAELVDKTLGLKLDTVDQLGERRFDLNGIGTYVKTSDPSVYLYVGNTERATEALAAHRSNS
jgi:hypothetical protein